MAATTPRPNGQGLRHWLCAVSASLLMAGCVQSTTGNPSAMQPEPVMAPAAAGDPVVLSGASLAGQQPAPPSAAAASASRVPAPAPRPSSDVAQTVESPDPVVMTPNPPVTPPPVVATSAPSPAPVPAASPVASNAAEDYPNINIPPPEPAGQLLSPEERARLIGELNALANRNNQ